MPPQTRITVNEKQEPEITYPFYGKYKNTDKVVLFTERNNATWADRKLAKGVVVHGDKHDSVGFTTDRWVVEDFEPFNGTIEIEST